MINKTSPDTQKTPHMADRHAMARSRGTSRGKTAAEILEDMTRKKLRVDSHKRWFWKRSFAGKIDGKPTLQVIEEELAAGTRVKAGYTCTQIRGYHDRWVLVFDSSRELHSAAAAGRLIQPVANHHENITHHER